MADIEISGLPPTTGIAGTDQLATKKGSTDFRGTVDQLTSFVKSQITDEEVFDAVLNEDGPSSGLHAQYLGGREAGFFMNASNLVAGAVSAGLLPNGSYATYHSGSQSRTVIKLPEFVAGVRLMVQFGQSGLFSANQLITTNFGEAFVSGLDKDNKPYVYVTPACEADGKTSAPFRVELGVRLDQDTVTLAGFSAATFRTHGSGADRVRCNWIAVGRY